MPELYYGNIKCLITVLLEEIYRIFLLKKRNL